MELRHWGTLLGKPGRSSLRDLSDVCVLPPEDGWVISGIFSVGRGVEDCVFPPFLPLSKNPSGICAGSSCVVKTVEDI